MSKVLILLGLMSVFGFNLVKSFNKTQIETGATRVISLPDGVAFTMIWVGPGQFLMGSPEHELERNPTREKQHQVTITKGYWLAQTEFTQANWIKLMKSNPSQTISDRLPVESVSYLDVMLLIDKLNTKTGFTFRLPTEAEWEFACRAGTTGPYSGDRDMTTWHSGNANRQLHAAATRLPNPWGFYDMNGNLLEWCSDWFQEDYSYDTLDPKGPITGSRRSLRGGQYTGRIRHSRAADRQSGDPSKGDFFIGFRLAMDD